MADQPDLEARTGPPTDPSRPPVDLSGPAPTTPMPTAPAAVPPPGSPWSDLTEQPRTPWSDLTEPLPAAGPVAVPTPVAPFSPAAGPGAHPAPAAHPTSTAPPTFAASPAFLAPPVPPAATSGAPVAAAGPTEPPVPPGPPAPPPGPMAEPAGPAAPAIVAARRPRRGLGGFLFGALVGGLAGALVASGIYLAVRDDTATQTTIVERGPSLELTDEPTDIAGVLAKVQPAVVAIRTGGAVEGGSGPGGAGSGFVITEDGYIVTNHHVVGDANGSISVTFDDGTTRAAKLVGSDPYEDLAVIKVEAEGLTVAELGSSEATQVGDAVIAIGNALALEGGPTVTTGIVSGLDRSIPTEDGPVLPDVIQTDAAINRGNSGGPLLNARGQVIGINTAVANPQYAQNVGFAIAIDHAKPILEELQAGRAARQAFLGVESVDLTPAIVREQDLDVDEGAYIRRVVPDSAAEGAGLRVGDVIVAIDGEPVDAGADVAAEIRAHRPGDEITLTYVRDGRERKVTVELGERP